MADRFFMASVEEDGRLKLSREESHHVVRVMRKQPGDVLELLDGRDMLYRAVIEEVRDGCVLARELARQDVQRELSIHVTLVQGLCKGDKMDLVVQKATELGAQSIVAVETKRSDVRLKPERAAKKRERWATVAREAVKQCGRGLVPDVSLAEDLEESLHRACASPCHLLVLYENETHDTLRDVLGDWHDGLPIVVFIGPEGGFAPDEMARLKDSGARSATLGRRILRTETAGLATLACLAYEFGEKA